MKYLLPSIALFLIFSAHDLFLKTDHYHLKPNTEYELELVNGTFDKSENAITRDRIIEPIIKGTDYEKVPTAKDWYDEGNIAHLRFKTAAPGTYIAGISTKPRTIEMSAQDFNEYLEHDGVLDVLSARKEHGELENSARELYAKHVKAILQVGEEITHHHFSEVLGYPTEFVPVDNPYELKVGDIAEFKLFSNSKTLADQLVYVGHRHHDEDDDHDHEDEADDDHEHDEYPLITDSDGIFRFLISDTGYWYLRTIHMVPANSDTLEYISNWATITFEVE